jgi:hypothetical protein
MTAAPREYLCGAAGSLILRQVAFVTGGAFA